MSRARVRRPRGPECVDCAAPVTRRLRVVCAAFGLGVRHAPRRGARASHQGRRARTSSAAALIDRRLKGGGIALITGPSGAGKSRTLRALHALLKSRGSRVIIVGAGRGGPLRRTILDEMAVRCGSSHAALGTLARAGLADARLLPRRVGELSDGQRRRFELACAMIRAEHERGVVTIIADEFASTLDRASAHSLCATMRRWVSRSPAVRMVCATAHDDILEMLDPELLVYQAEHRRPAVLARGGKRGVGRASG